MPYDISAKLVIGIASSALFDLKDSDRVFRTQGERAYRLYQREHEHELLPKGVAFPFIRRLLTLNTIFTDEHPVEVILFSRNDPDTGQRVYNSIASYGLDITRGVFTSGASPYIYLKAFEVSLFLSSDGSDVKKAIAHGCAAGQVLSSSIEDSQEDTELRVGFDFDGIIADDAAENMYQQQDLAAFQTSEKQMASTPHEAGPLRDFFVKLSALQALEHSRQIDDPEYHQHIKTAIITARNAPSTERVVTTLRSMDVTVDQTFFLGGIEKQRVLDVFKPHMFFDDQLIHLEASRGFVPSVHVPFGQINS